MDSNVRQTVLVVDDSALNRQMLTDLLRSDYAVISARNGEQGLELARQHQPDLILLDVVMPGLDGHEVLRLLKADGRTAVIGVIFITGLDSAAEEERGLRAGASDYVVKPFHAAVVRARVALHLQLARQRRLLEQLARIDGLTEIPNRRHFDGMLAQETARASRGGVGLALVLLDVDCFKQYNDHYGHAKGDRALQSIARVLQAGLRRPADLAARYGGEEFVLLMPDTDLDGAAGRAERLREAVEQLGLPHAWSDAAPCVTVSMGIAHAARSEDLSGAALLLQADRRLYVAKRTGRNRVVAEG
ncbi:diguanylate cyclase [Pseudorhodoferax soli]|uniref:diguanylate cyclase n=1 Tax=Pseudorhodoferax soli TaxID=545864 RepID=A0A368Y972_9BURK|nr:diguanylate cyclase [Pseudorhodoferax soli]RCW75968.1 response regulator receiver modulated diguanylate cyclase [Pseudorhodoferax soli]